MDDDDYCFYCGWPDCYGECEDYDEVEEDDE